MTMASRVNNLLAQTKMSLAHSKCPSFCCGPVRMASSGLSQKGSL